MNKEGGEGSGSGGERVAESWEEAGDEVSVQVEQRQKQLLKKKHKEEEMKAAIRHAQQQQQQQQQQQHRQHQLAGAIKILRRPQSCGTLPSSSSSTPSSTLVAGATPSGGAGGGLSAEEQQSKQRSFEERQAAYQEARQRIFGMFTPEEEDEESEQQPGHVGSGGGVGGGSEADLGPTLVPLPPSTLNSPTGLGPHLQQTRATTVLYTSGAGGGPRMRAAAPIAALRTIRPPHFQPIPANQGIVYSLPPPLGVVYGPLPGPGAPGAAAAPPSLLQGQVQVKGQLQGQVQGQPPHGVGVTGGIYQAQRLPPHPLAGPATLVAPPPGTAAAAVLSGGAPQPTTTTTIKPRPVAFYDSRIPPPIAGPTGPTGSAPGTVTGPGTVGVGVCGGVIFPIGTTTVTTSTSTVTALNGAGGAAAATRVANPVPYGRPPVQLLSQSQFSTGYGGSPNPGGNY